MKIWDISAGDPSLNYLRLGDFYVAMRLIAMAQVRHACMPRNTRVTRQYLTCVLVQLCHGETSVQLTHMTFYRLMGWLSNIVRTDFAPLAFLRHR